MTFRFRRMRRFCINFTLLMVLFVSISIAAEMRGQIWSGLLVILTFIPIILLSGIIMITGLMDIDLNDLGISRCFLGVTWQFIEWKNVKTILIFDGFDREFGKLTHFNVFPLVLPKYRIVPSGKIVFNDEGMINFQEFRVLINNYIRINKIDVRRKINGIHVVVDNI